MKQENFRESRQINTYMSHCEFFAYESDLKRKIWTL